MERPQEISDRCEHSLAFWYHVWTVMPYPITALLCPGLAVYIVFLTATGFAEGCAIRASHLSNIDIRHGVAPCRSIFTLC